MIDAHGIGELLMYVHEFKTRNERLYGLFGLESSLRGYAHPTNVGALAQAARHGFVPSPKMDGTKTRLPADFLIDEEGLIRDVFYADVISAHIPFERVERFAV